MKRILFIVVYLVQLNVTAQANCKPKIFSNEYDKNNTKNAVYTKLSNLLQEEFEYQVNQHDSAGKNIIEIEKWIDLNNGKMPLSYLGTYFYIKGRQLEELDAKKSLVFFQKSIKISEKKQDNIGVCYALLAISQLNVTRFGDLPGSINEVKSNTQLAWKIAKSKKCIELQIRTLATESLLYNLRDNTNLEKYKELTLMQLNLIQESKLPNVLIADVYKNLGIVYSKQDKFNQAYYYLSKADSIYQNYSSQKKQLLSKTNLGIVLAEQGNFDEALRMFNSVLTKSKETDYATKRAIHGNIFILLKLKGEYSKAIDHLDSSKSYFEKVVLAKNAYELNKLQVKYETEKNKRRSLELESEKTIFQKRMIISFLFSGVLLLAALVIGIQFRQVRNRNKALQRANSEIKELNDARAYLFGIIAHDLRRPLHAFQGINELVSYYLKKKEYHEIEQISNLIDESGQRIQLMLDNLLKWSLSQKTEIPYEPTNLNVSQVVESTLELYKGLERAYEIKIDSFVPSDLVIYADRVGIELILRNLIDNASKVVTAGGRIYITARRRDTEILLEIGDTGTGIPENKRALLENAFAHPEKLDYTNKELGLGIVLISKFTQRNRGKIRFTTEKDKGTLFQLFFPATEE